MATVSYVRCKSCGGSYEDEDGGLFCPHCGAEHSALAQSPPPPTIAPSQLPTPDYRPPAPPSGLPVPPSGPPAPPSGARRPNRDRPWLIGLGVAALLILAGIGAGLYFGGVFNSSASSQSATPASSATPAPGSPSTGVPQTPTTSTPAAGSTSSGPATTTPSPGGSTPSSPPTSPASVIQTHLEDINSGQYQAAYQLLTNAYQSANPSWPSDRATADPGIKLLSVGTPQFGSGDAQVPVDFYARDRNPSPGSDTQCREFQGTVNMVQESGSWRYDPSGSSLTNTVMPMSDPNCPS